MRNHIQFCFALTKTNRASDFLRSRRRFFNPHRSNMSTYYHIVFGEQNRHKKRSRIRKNQAPEKKSGIELLSHSQICSTIVAGPLIDRVRDGNVSYKPAMDTGKKGLKMLGLCRLSLSGRQANSKLGNCDFVENAAWCFFRSDVLADIGRKKRWSSLTTG